MKWLIDGDTPHVLELVGFIPTMLDEADERSAAEQFASNYQAGWRPMPGFVLLKNGDLKYPGDPPLQSVAYSKLRNELIMIYPHAWVAIVQLDGSFEVARMD